MAGRVYGDKVEIDYGSTLGFFESRGDGKELGTKYNYVLFQDDTPEIAIERDRQEKEKICSALNWEGGGTVLDIGCGIGRWGEAVLKKGGIIQVLITVANFLGLQKKTLRVIAA